MSEQPSPRELATEALEALRAAPEDPRQHFQRLVERGWITTRGEVTKLLGGEAEPESTADSKPTADTNHTSATPANGAPAAGE
jgi:hypothetical protein